jgi:hypothetical protein
MTLFAKAKKTAPATAAKGKKDARQEININGLGDYAIVDAVVKGFTALQKTLAESVKDEMSDVFATQGEAIGKRPDNFKGIDNDNTQASASCELRCRSSASALSDEEAEKLTELGIPFSEVVTQEDCFIINPAYFSDQAMLEKVSKALEKVKDLPEDFIMHQTKVSKKVVTEESMEAVFKKGLAASLLSIVGTLAIKPKFDGSLTEAVTKAKALAGLVDKKAA